MKIRLVRSELLQTGGERDMKKPLVTFRNFTNPPKM